MCSPHLLLRTRLYFPKTIKHSFIANTRTLTETQSLFQFEKHANFGNISQKDQYFHAAGVDFAASRRGSLFQEAPMLRNQFNADIFMQSYLRRILPVEVSWFFMFLDLTDFFNAFLQSLSLLTD